jgi:hypothetical protein
MWIIVILVLGYLGFGILLSIYDANQTDEKINWGVKETWLGFLKWPAKFFG